MTFEEAFVERDRWNSQVAENSARGAWAWGTAHTNGWGEHTFGKPIMFGLTMVEEPLTSYGFALDDDDQLEDNRFPRCSGGVARWVQDSRGFYIGAHVFVTVATADPLLGTVSLYNSKITTEPDAPAPPPSEYLQPVNYDITHHWTFFGLSIKDITSGMVED